MNGDSVDPLDEEELEDIIDVVLILAKDKDRRGGLRGEGRARERH